MKKAMSFLDRGAEKSSFGGPMKWAVHGNPNIV